MRPQNLKTKIFLDSGSPDDTKEALNLLSFLDGQTTNPTLISKNPKVQERISQGKKFTEREAYDFYREVVIEISKLIPGGSVSVEVYSDQDTPADKLFSQGQEMFSWITNAHVKYPVTTSGLEAAERSIKNGMRVNMTLCFSAEQAAAVYSATRGARKGQVFISPFVGRLEDRGENGMSLVENILSLYKSGDGHVETLVASVRNINHFIYSLALKADIITAPLKILKEWKDHGMEVPSQDYKYEKNGLSDLDYHQLDLNSDWRSFNIYHSLTEAGIKRFSEDWNSLIQI